MSSRETVKYVLWGFLGLALLAFLVLILLAVQSRTPPVTLGLDGGRLRPCPATPNCVSSQAPQETARVAPLAYSGSARQAWRRLQQVIEAAGGDIVTRQDAYLHATFVTPWLRFVDDVECLLDARAGVIHVRSASRTGRSDFGVNRKRVEAIRSGLSEMDYR